MEPERAALVGAIAICATAAVLQAILCDSPRRMFTRFAAIAARMKGKA